VIAEGVAEDKFRVNSTSGQITTTTALDRETRDSWIITGYYYTLLQHLLIIIITTTIFIVLSS